MSFAVGKPRAAFLALLLSASLLVGVACGESDRTASAGEPSAPRVGDIFDEPAAWRLIKLQLGFGQRTAGSPALRRLALKLRKAFPEGRFERIPGEPRLRNIVSVLPGTLPAVVIGAHYDVLAKPKGFVGANNGAAGSAIVIGLARTFAAIERPPGSPQLRFVLFDGEEPAQGLPEEQTDFYHSGLRGSRAYVRAHGGKVGAMVLLDYVANKGLQLPRETDSTQVLWDELRAAADRVGASSYFPPTTQLPITDDHSPFLVAGIPAIDLIDFSYPGHEVTDTLDKLSHRSVDAVGESVAALLSTFVIAPPTT